MPLFTYAQSFNQNVFKEIVLKLDTSNYSLKDTLHYQAASYMPLKYTTEWQTCEVKLFPKDIQQLKHIQLVESGDYSLVDSLVNFNNQYYTFKVQFRRLSQSDFLRFRFNCLLDTISQLVDIPLLPIAQTSVQLINRKEELILGEEKMIELFSNQPENIKPILEWQQGSDIDYRIVEKNGKLFLHLMPNGTSVGSKSISVNIQSNKPVLRNGKLTTLLDPINCTFNVKSGGLIFLHVDADDIVLDENAKAEGITVLLDYNKGLQMNVPYLVEEKETNASPLVAEIIPKERVLNNKVLCSLRVFNYHQKSGGFLYLKDYNNNKFITNFNVIHKVTVDKVKIMRNGTDWVEDNVVYPGELVLVRLEGHSLNKARIKFPELQNLTHDSISNESYAEFKLKVPIDISKKTIDILNFNESTKKNLVIKEYRLASPFNYININYSGEKKVISDIRGPELYDKTIKDVVVSFSPEKIDSLGKLYGKQYLSMEIKVLGKKNEIIDIANVDNIVVCPNEKSPRYQYYDKADCKNSEISINSKISNSTYNLSDWSKLILTFKNQQDKYTQDIQTKRVEIVLQKHYDFDIDVSFPTGLLIKKRNEEGFGQFSSVSMAIIGQYSFYAKDKINKLRPYKLGAGFLALNAFDFSSADNTSRDFGAVVLGTLNPVNTDRKLTFSLYLGGGYLFSNKTLFWLIGPGISVKL